MEYWSHWWSQKCKIRPPSPLSVDVVEELEVVVGREELLDALGGGLSHGGLCGEKLQFE